MDWKDRKYRAVHRITGTNQSTGNNQDTSTGHTINIDHEHVVCGGHMANISRYN